jgi:hypothetical protein
MNQGFTFVVSRGASDVGNTLVWIEVVEVKGVV